MLQPRKQKLYVVIDDLERIKGLKSIILFEYRTNYN